MKTSDEIIEIIEATSVIEDCINGKLSTTVAYGILKQALSKALPEQVINLVEVERLVKDCMKGDERLCKIVRAKINYTLNDLPKP